MSKPRFEQLPLLPGTPGMEAPGPRPRRKPRSPGEHEMEEALQIRDPETQARNVARIELRNAEFKTAFRVWQNAHRHETHTDNATEIFYDGCVRCDARITDACLLYNGKAYCAVCRNEVWQEMGRRVGLYL